MREQSLSATLPGKRCAIPSTWMAFCAMPSMACTTSKCTELKGSRRAIPCGSATTPVSL